MSEEDLFWERWKRGEIPEPSVTSDPPVSYSKPEVNNIELAIISSRSDTFLDALTKLRDRYEAILKTKYRPKQ
jgi:hypothetical protein